MSPLYDLAPRDILSKQFEIIVTLDGTTQETGNQIQVRIIVTLVVPIISLEGRSPKDLRAHAVLNYKTRREPVLDAALGPLACPSRSVSPHHPTGVLGHKVS